MKKRTVFCCTLTLLLAFALLTACSPAKPPADNAQAEATVSKDAEEIGRIVTAFSEAYFSGDTETIKSYLTESASSDIEVYSGGEEIVLSPLPDFSDIPEQEIGDAQTVSLPYMYRNCIADLQLSVDDINEDYIASGKALLISGTALAESPSREAALKAVMFAKKTKTPIIFDIDYREYNWKNEDEISIYYSTVANEADIIMGSRQEFDLTERLIQPNMTDEETAKYWQAKNAKVVVIKHGMKGSTAYLNNGESYSIKPFPVKSRKGFGGGDGYASGFLYGIYQEWPMIDCLEFGSAEASMMVRSNNCSDDLPTTEEVKQFIKETKEQYGEMIARI